MKDNKMHFRISFKEPEWFDKEYPCYDFQHELIPLNKKAEDHVNGTQLCFMKQNYYKTLEHLHNEIHN